MAIFTFIYHTICELFIMIHPLTYRDIARYCFGNLIQTELNQFVEEWNSHRIRPIKTADAPAGIPNVLFFSHL